MGVVVFIVIFVWSCELYVIFVRVGFISSFAVVFSCFRSWVLVYVFVLGCVFVIFVILIG